MFVNSNSMFVIRIKNKTILIIFIIRSVKIIIGNISTYLLGQRFYGCKRFVMLSSVFQIELNQKSRKRLSFDFLINILFQKLPRNFLCFFTFRIIIESFA